MKPKATFKNFLNFSSKQKISIFFSQFLILILLPRTYWRIYKNLIRAKKDKHITGFSSQMAFIFTYYLRIDETIKEYGRSGYAFEDALGFSLKDRFWLNHIALRIYNKLRIQKFTALVTFVLLGSIFFIGLIEGAPFWLLIILMFLIGGSSLFLIPFFRLAKPETLSWAFFPLIFYSFLKGYFLFSGVLCLFLSFLNFTTTLLIIEMVFVYSVISFNILGGLLFAILPSIKLFFNFFPFLKRSFISGMFEVLGGGNNVKSRSKNFLKLRPNDIYLGFFYFLFIFSLFLTNAPLSHQLVLLNVLFIFFFNQTFFRFADNNTFFRLFFVTSSLFLLVNFNFLTLSFYILLIYVSSIGLTEKIEDIIAFFPHLKPRSIKSANDFFEKFFSKIPDQSRIIFEREDTEKEMSGFAVVLYYLEYIFFKRNIDIPPMEYLRLTQTEYFMNEYVKINSRSDKETIEKKMKELGGDYLLVYSKEFAQKLLSWGYIKIGVLKWQEIKSKMLDLDLVPKKDLFLFQPPFDNNKINPKVNFKRSPNKIEFKAGPGKYVIKYNFHPNWEAFVNGKEIKVEKAEGNLSFLSVDVPEKGTVELKFNTNWLK